MRFPYEVDCKTGIYTDRNTGQIWVNGCKKRACKDCGPVLASGISHKVSPYLDSFNYFMTINLLGDISPTADNCTRLMLPNIFVWLKRNAGLKGYFWVLGYGPEKGLHRHLLLNLDYRDREMLEWNLSKCIERVQGDVSMWVQPRYSDGALDYLVANYLEAVKVLPKGTKAKGLIKPKPLEMSSGCVKVKTDHYVDIYS